MTTKVVPINSDPGIEIKRCYTLQEAIDAAWGVPGSWITEGPMGSREYPTWYSIRVSAEIKG